jgi:uncharacterized membrane protein YphA (DoxX/SURF4 family)
MNEKYIKLCLVIILSLLYFFSAYNKIINFNKVAEDLYPRLEKYKLPHIFKWIPFNFSKLALIIAILLLIAGPVLLMYGIISENNIYTRIGAGFLIIFLILATILYHPISEPKEINNILKNLSLMGGLGILML